MKVGQKVVSLETWEAAISKTKHGEKFPIQNEIYTIREFVNPIPPSLGPLYLRLKEIVNPVVDYGNGIYECCFNTSAFRPVDESFGEEVADKMEDEFFPLEIAERVKAGHFGE